ncbi:MAG: MFS transporter [Alphaproteobacteria bacterium]|nr:MFS transporter [Alphaproteobacteria bacterium]MCB9929087.1 MFS transporter [Alphaproteobacteria bacterium]
MNDASPIASRPAQPAAEDGLPRPRRIWAIAAISFGTALFVVDGTIANVALPTIAHDLGTDLAAVVSVVTVYQLIMVMGLLPFANLGERIGLRRLYQLGQLVFMLGSGLALLAHSLPILLGVRAIQALGAGMALSVSSALIRQTYPRSRLGSGLGINSVIVASSNALAPVLGGFLVAHGDWHWLFVAGVPLAVASLLLGRTLPDPVRGQTPLDPLAALWSAVGFGLLIGGIEYTTHGGPVAAGTVASLLGAVALMLLARREGRHRAPVLPVDLVRDPAIGLSSLAAVLGFLGAAGLMVALPFRLQEAMHYSPDDAGLMIMAFPLTMLVVSPLAGWLSDRVRAALLGAVGLAVACCGFALVAFLPTTAGAFDLSWRLVVAATGLGLFFAPNARMIVGRAPHSRAAAAGALLSTGRLLGQTLGAAGVGVLLSMGAGLGPTPMLIGIGLEAIAALCIVSQFWIVGQRTPSYVKS